jgi:hypothetical protein
LALEYMGEWVFSLTSMVITHHTTDDYVLFFPTFSDVKPVL